MKRLLLAQPSLQPPGGGNGVAAWIIEAVKSDYEISVLAWSPVDLDSINRYYATSLRSSDFEILKPNLALRRLLNTLPMPLSLLKTSILLRTCKRIKNDYDVIISANNESDFGRAGIQYVHFPWAYQPRPRTELRWYHFPPALKAYYDLCAWVAAFSFERMKQNLTLVNSNWTGSKFKERHGCEAVTLYPPVPGNFPEVPWEEREDGFVCIGRISPEKELEKLIGIVGKLRPHGKNVHLHIIGTTDNRSYYQKISRLARDNASWITLNENISRNELTRIVTQHRYGIHGMREEHLGIAVAEMIRGGCIVFAPRGGGQMEVIGNDDRLLYNTADEAALKIEQVMENSHLQNALRSHLAARRELFSAERFCREMRVFVRDFLAQQANPTSSFDRNGIPRADTV